MKRLLLPLLCLCTLLAACNKSEKDIEEQTASGVVLVQSQSYYEVVLSNGESIYFSKFDEKDGIEGLATDEDSVEVVTSYGTGFFISPNGEIATNAHVVSNMVADKEVNKSVAKVIDALKKVIVLMYRQCNEKLQTAQQACAYAYYSSGIDYTGYYRICEIRDGLQEELQQYEAYYNNLDELRASDSEIKYHNRVSIAYNDTYVTGSSDFTPCVVTKNDAEHDLAILQLKDKKTPQDKHIFSIPEKDPLEEYSLMESLTAKVGTDKNAKIFMTSYNLGPALALTKEGIKSQFNNGSISQRTSDRLMYSIPALPGSSGSPVVNLRGELVAVNYAGINSTQNFNYGIRIKHLRALMNK